MNGKKKHLRTAAALLCGAAAIAALSYFAGWRAASARAGRTVTFYATVTQVQGGSLLAAGSEDNDVNHRGAFDLRISDGTRLLAGDGAGITAADLDAGDLIAVTYTGAVQESNPAVIPRVEAIQLLAGER